MNATESVKRGIAPHRGMFLSAAHYVWDYQVLPNNYDRFLKLAQCTAVEERLYKKLYSSSNLDFLFLSLFVKLLKYCPFSVFQSAEPVFHSEEPQSNYPVLQYETFM
mgnify:CR=1 FL=1